jgi:hypothetical protein
MKKRIVVAQTALARLSGVQEVRVQARMEQVDAEGNVLSYRLGEVTVQCLNSREIAIGVWSET